MPPRPPTTPMSPHAAPLISPMPRPHRYRYSLDFTLTFIVQTDNPDYRNIDPAEVARAFLARVRQVMPLSPVDALAHFWPPVVYDHDTGNYTSSRPTVIYDHTDGSYTIKAPDPSCG